MRLLVTAGPTREAIDAVRYITNPSTGKAGFAIAQVAAEQGWAVTLVAGPVTLPCPPGVDRVDVTTAQQMFDAAQQAFSQSDAAVFTAAVCDHAPARPAGRKLHKNEMPDSLPLIRTVDIAATLSHQKGNRVTIGFALETDDAEASALMKIKEKNLDYIIVNSPSSFGSDRMTAVLLGGEKPVAYDSMSKLEMARRVIDLLSRTAEPPA